MKPEVGDLFYFEVAYEDDPNHSKRRPVLILHEDDENVLLQQPRRKGITL